MEVVSCFSLLRLPPFPEEEVNCPILGVSLNMPLSTLALHELYGSSQLAEAMETDGQETEAAPN